MSEFTNEFRKALSNKLFSEKLLIPILNWLSGYRDNIEMCQRINKRLLLRINRNIFISEVAYIFRSDKKLH